MPELPEVETVKEILKQKLLNHKIIDVVVLYPNIISCPDPDLFCSKIKGETILNLERRGKWLLFELNQYYLLSHLRMEGKYVFRKNSEEYEKHEHVVFTLDSGEELRYKDTRKFGRMYLYEKDKVWTEKPLSSLGLEPWDISESYLQEKLKLKTIPIKTSLLDQTIVAGIGNIYANEILFLSKIDPYAKSNTLTSDQLKCLVINTKEVLKKAIEQGGTTIRTFEASEGVHGLFQQELYVHGKEHKPCLVCGNPILKITIGGRGTYYCSTCQK